MSEAKHNRTELERQVLSSITLDTAAWLIGLPRTTLASRKPPKNEDGTLSARDVVAWLLGQIADESAPAPGQPSIELEKWRAIRRRREEIEYGRQIGEIVSRAVIQQELADILTPIRHFGERCIRTHPDTAGADWLETLERVDEVIEQLCPPGNRHRELIVQHDGEELRVPLDNETAEVGQ